MNGGILKDMRFIILSVLIVASLAMIAAPYYVRMETVTISSVDQNIGCSVQEGDIINEINSVVIRSEGDFTKAMKSVKKDDRISMIVNSKPFSCEAVDDMYMGFGVYKEELKTLHFGIDVEGGTRVLLKPNGSITRDQLAETVKTLENRINFYGLSEVKVTTLGNNIIQIEMAGATGDDIREFLSKQGRFEAKLGVPVRLVDKKGSLKLGNRTHNFTVDKNEISIAGGRHGLNETFVIDGETVSLVHLTNTSAIFYEDLFTGDDIVNVLTDSQNSGVQSVGNGFYEFSFGIQVSKEGADRFAKLTRGYPSTVVSGGDRYIEPKLLLFLDDRPITELNIGSTIAGQSVTRAVITGTENSREGAGKEKLRLESTLRSGKLPVRMEIEKVDTITQTAGRDLINSTILVAIASVIAVGVIVSLRYRDYKIVVPMILVSLSEIVVVVGMATSQILAAVVIAAGILIGIWKKEVVGVLGWVTLLIMVMAASTVAISTWTIDIPVIAGLIAIMGTGVNQMIIMTDQLVREKGKQMNERHRSAMHIIWSSAAIVVFAMIPLIMGGIGALKGFAIATIIGVFVGILVTRPAYVAIIERIKKLHMEV